MYGLNLVRLYDFRHVNPTAEGMRLYYILTQDVWTPECTALLQAVLSYRT